MSHAFTSRSIGNEPWTAAFCFSSQGNVKCTLYKLPRTRGKKKNRVTRTQSSWLLSCYSAISLAAEFSISFCRGTGNNEDQTLQSTEEDSLSLIPPLNRNACGRSVLFQVIAVVIMTPSVSVSYAASSGARGESASVRTYSCWGAEVRTVRLVN